MKKDMERHQAVGKELHFSDDELQRYSRHLVMPQVGPEGQEKLKRASVLIVGVGGLGSPAAMYLAAAGIGRIGLVDSDVVNITNLQRQILHSTKSVGKSKVVSACETLERINPFVRIDTFEKRLTSENALETLREYDVAVDCSDNFPARYLINDTCVLLGKPDVYGSVFQFDGQLSVFCVKNGNLEQGPCYRCLYPSPPPPGLVPDCAEGGVLGVLPGIIGSLQALETIKLILGKGEILRGKLLLFDAMKSEFRELKVRRRSDCPVCGDHPTIRELIPEEVSCGAEPKDEAKRENHEITVEELNASLRRGKKVFLLDVREPYEYEICNLGGYLIPMNQLPDRLDELDPAHEMVVYCKKGIRSARTVKYLQEHGFSNVKNLVEGIDAWAQRVDPSMRRY
jgi:adenylyltransferase/sulfurtransferase